MKNRDETTPPRADASTFDNPADQAVMEQVSATLAAGGDPFGDNDPPEGEGATPPPPSPAPAPSPSPAEVDDEDEVLADETATAPAPAPEPAPSPAAAATTAGESEAAAPAAPAAAPATPQPAPPPPVLQFKTRSEKDLLTEQDQLMTKKANAFKEYSDGTLSAEDFAKVDAEVMQGLLRIGSERTLAQASALSMAATQEQAIEQIKATARTAGQIDYDADPSAIDQFNAAIDMVGRDPKAATMSHEEFYGKAHALVLAARGISATAAAPSPAPAPAPAVPRKDEAGPITLRTLPAAATPNTGGGITEQLSRLQGLEFEDAIAALPKAQRDAWMDS